MAAIEACNWVALTNVVVRAEPFQFTTEPLTNPLPFTANVNPVDPTVTLLGVIEVSTGRGLGAVIVKTAAAEAPPPGAGFRTVTCAVPAAATSAAVTAACSCVVLTRVVVREEPFHCTVEPVKNPLPFTMSVKPGAPATAVEGETEEMTGAGFEANTLTAPPLPDTGVSVPSGRAPTRPVIDNGIDESLAVDASVMVTAATVPLPIPVVFMPEATHITDPDAALHVIAFPAVTAAGPAATLSEAISADGYESVH